MSCEEYSCWNDASVAHIFIRLITKTKYSSIITDTSRPDYNENILTLEEFNRDYKTLEGYIEWKRINNPIHPFSFYNFTPDNMTSFLQLINYETNNRDGLIRLWENVMMQGFNIAHLSQVKN